ncbi:tail fiber protein [Klebsiella phage VLCpiA1a]|nr:tail fiber protein [Klebsiella phage VLCpiA1a]
MAYSWQESVKPAGTQDIQCDIEYLDKSYIHVYLDGAETTAFTWTSSTNIRLNSPLSAETVVLLIRKTEREYLYIEFASGAPFIEGNVDSQNTQFLHLAQELVEGRAIDGFYGDINMHSYRITNLGDPVDAGDAANKQYVDAGDARLDQRVDAEEAARKSADAILDTRVTNLEQTFISDKVTVSYPWFTVLDTATDTVTPPIAFSKAIVELNGVGQIPNYSFVVVENSLLFAETLPAGTLVAARLGADVEAGDGYVTQAAFDNWVASVGELAYKDSANAVADSTDTSNVATQLNALLAALRSAGIIKT